MAITKPIVNVRIKEKDAYPKLEIGNVYKYVITNIDSDSKIKICKVKKYMKGFKYLVEDINTGEINEIVSFFLHPASVKEVAEYKLKDK